MVDIRIESFTIHDSGNPTVGIFPKSWELSGGFFFDSPSDIEAFKKDLASVFQTHLGDSIQVFTNREMSGEDNDTDLPF